MIQDLQVAGSTSGIRLAALCWRPFCACEGKSVHQMYISGIQIQNIRSLRQVNWFDEGEDHAGWHVILGDNGSGKSSFIRAVALALVGPAEAKALRQDWNEWLRKDEAKGSVKLILEQDSDYDRFVGRGPIPSTYLHAGLNLNRQPDETVTLSVMSTKVSPERFVWGGREWFSAAYGPFRRFSGGDKDYEKIYYSNPRLAPHLSAFGESVALTESIQWLQDLKFKQL